MGGARIFFWNSPYRVPGVYCLHDLSTLFSTDHMMIPPSMNSAMMLDECFLKRFVWFLMFFL